MNESTPLARHSGTVTRTRVLELDNGRRWRLVGMRTNRARTLCPTYLLSFVFSFFFLSVTLAPCSSRISPMFAPFMSLNVEPGVVLAVPSLSNTSCRYPWVIRLCTTQYCAHLSSSREHTALVFVLGCSGAWDLENY